MKPSLTSKKGRVLSNRLLRHGFKEEKGNTDRRVCITILIIWLGINYINRREEVMHHKPSLSSRRRNTTLFALPHALPLTKANPTLGTPELGLNPEMDIWWERELPRLHQEGCYSSHGVLKTYSNTLHLIREISEHTVD